MCFPKYIWGKISSVRWYMTKGFRGKYVWEMLHIITQSRNNTRKFYNEETWPTNWNMQPIFFLIVTDNTQVCSTGCYVCEPVWDFWILASACHSLTMWSWSSPTTPSTKGGEGMAQMLSALLFYVSWNDQKVSFQSWDSRNHFSKYLLSITLPVGSGFSSGNKIIEKWGPHLKEGDGHKNKNLYRSSLIYNGVISW